MGNLLTYQVFPYPYQHANHQVKAAMRSCAWTACSSLVTSRACRVLGPELPSHLVETLRLDWK